MPNGTYGGVRGQVVQLDYLHARVINFNLNQLSLIKKREY